MRGLTASVIIEKTAFSFDKPYDYLIPENLTDSCRPGCRVVVPFGRGNTPRQGLVMSVGEKETDTPLKNILRVVDKTPILNDEMLRLTKWLHETLFCTYFDAVNAVLPAGITLRITEKWYVNDTFSGCEDLSDSERAVYELVHLRSGITTEAVLQAQGSDAAEILEALQKKDAIVKNSDAVRRMQDSTAKSVRLLCTAEEIGSFTLTSRQTEVAEYLLTGNNATVKEIQYYTGASVSVIDALVKKNIAEYFKKEIFRMPTELSGHTDKTDIILTDEQQSAFEALRDKLSSGGGALLYGVTGSGKTQVFLSLVDEVIERRQGVIIMVPEISLTPQTISIFSSRYGKNIAVFHSAMSLGQRMDEWKRIKNGDALIAIGTRSAIFAPFDNLGLIIMDEEQEHTYKSEQSPRFHARDIARFRAGYHKSLFVMASATPSVETYTAAKSGKYTLCTLKNRYGSAVLPDVEIVDMKAEMLSGNSGAISGVLYSEIENAIASGNQAIVLLNRRGHNTYISCPSCGTVLSCPNCSVSMTYHSANKRVMCHYCGHSDRVPDRCSECGEEHLKFSGMGTQKVEEELSLLFPDARILRIDADSTASKDSYSQYLTAFGNGEYDIMLGTQMVAKGLDFPNVTVVGVLGADRSMNSGDYRSVERTFSLLTQVVGRAGRGDKPGKAIIQTADTDNNIIYMAQNQDYDAFYNSEIMLRRVMTYPPYCDIICLSVQSLSGDLAHQTAADILGSIKTLVGGEYEDVKLIILGPTAALMPKINNKYKFKLIIKCKNNRRTRQLIKTAVDIRMPRDTSVTIDINPESVI